MAHSKRRPRPETQKMSKKKKSLREAENDSEEVSLTDAKNDIKKLHTDIKDLWKRLQKNRFKTIPTSRGPYRSDRWIWQGVILCVFLWLWFIAHSYDYNMDYYRCGENGRVYPGQDRSCENPFYKSGDWWKCEPELPYGEYGKPPGKLFNSAGTVAFLIMVVGGLLNHFWHNRRYGR